MVEILGELMQLRALEQEKFAKIKETNPDSITRQENIDPKALLDLAGIRISGNLVPGYIRLYNQDFIVEEVGLDGKVSTIEPENNFVPVPNSPTIYVDLVKYGMGTIEAVTQLANILKVPVERIQYAGLKDGRALTSQKVSIRGLRGGLNELPTLTHSFVKSVQSSKGAMAPGMLKGNRFTIFIRTKEGTNNEELEKKIHEIEKNGFANFYGVQRFGNRFLNPLLGKLLCQNNAAEATKVFLLNFGPLDLPLYKELRERAKGVFGNWSEMLKIYDEFPYSFRHERAVVASLINFPDDYKKAISTISDQVKFWVYGYVSYLVNELLSEAVAGKVNLPTPLPLPLGSDFKSDGLYQKRLLEDGTDNYNINLRQFPFLIRKPRSIEPWIMPEVNNLFFVPEGVIISFTLPKGVYATTFLTAIFELFESAPIPNWVKITTIDTKATLETGSVQDSLEHLKVDISEKALGDNLAISIGADLSSE